MTKAERAEEARRILQSEVFREACRKTRERIFEDWTQAATVEARERIHAEWKASGRVIQELYRYINDLVQERQALDEGGTV